MLLKLSWEKNFVRDIYAQALCEKCPTVTSSLSLTNSMPKGIPYNTSYISLEHAVLLRLKEVDWWSSLFNLLKGLLSIGTCTWSLSLLIVGNKWNMSSLIYSTQRTIGMAELTNTKQWKDKPILNYIIRWRSLILECKDHLSETSAIKICTQSMEWHLLYVLQISKPRTFQELATDAHDMEMTITRVSRKG